MLARPFVSLRHQFSRICSDSHMDFQGSGALGLWYGEILRPSDRRERARAG